ncbi:DUF2141 domain-containing protein [Paraferrimonas sp. SM1919]|uniref:DUF2141 domain-containing protein n=1 Tax=Paraferrimonas sp. SM1919 TaxID=2662263 RepID=UPI0013D1F3DB|nr:DUF2141 domain-containing protein [Paraferrimonas sp. SM1919]
MTLKRMLLIATTVFVGNVMAEPLTVTIDGIKSNQGNIVVQFYDNKKDWMEEDLERMVHKKVLSAADLQGTTTFDVELNYGEYAIYVYHDKDANGELNSNWIGIPREPVGCSNNAKGSMGPPKYKDAKFSFNAEQNSHSLTIVEL